MLTRKELEAHFTPKQTTAILDLIEGRKHPMDYESVLNWVRRCYHEPRHEEQVLEAINEVLEGFGVESFSTDSAVVSYVNMGDTYDATILLHGQDFVVSSWGDYFEALELEEAEED
jgi:hypothetical protein